MKGWMFPTSTHSIPPRGVYHAAALSVARHLPQGGATCLIGVGRDVVRRILVYCSLTEDYTRTTGILDLLREIAR